MEIVKIIKHNEKIVGFLDGQWVGFLGVCFEVGR